MQVQAISTSLFRSNDQLLPFISKHIKKLQENSILVITSKIVALSQGRVIPTNMRDEHIRCVSTQIINTPWALLTLMDDGWCINAGVDDSNANGECITLPKKSFEYAHTLLTQLKKHYHIKNLGVIIADTRSMPLRVGTVGRAIGCAGFRPTKSYVGKKDLYGRTSRVTVSNVADALAASAVLVMGEGNEQTPLAVIQNAPITFTQSKLKNVETRLFLLPEEDIFTYLYKDASGKLHKHPKK